MATERENREYGAYIQKALGRKTQRLPTHMQVSKTGPNGEIYQDIVDDPDELKELLKDSTWEELEYAAGICAAQFMLGLGGCQLARDVRRRVCGPQILCANLAQTHTAGGQPGCCS